MQVVTTALAAVTLYTIWYNRPSMSIAIGAVTCVVNPVYTVEGVLDAEVAAIFKQYGSYALFRAEAEPLVDFVAAGIVLIVDVVETDVGYM